MTTYEEGRNACAVGVERASNAMRTVQFQYEPGDHVIVRRLNAGGVIILSSLTEEGIAYLVEFENLTRRWCDPGILSPERKP